MTKYIKTVDEAYAEVQENQVKLQEPLSPNAKAGDYIKDFRKSDAPQFKGKSEKQRDKMAVAAYLDSKKEGIDESSKYLRYSDLLLQKGKMLGKNPKADTKKIDKEIEKEMKKLGVKPDDAKKYYSHLTGLESVEDIKESLGHVVTFKPKDQDETFTTAFKTEKLAKEFAKEKETIGDKILSINEIEIPYDKYMLMVKEKFQPGFAVRYLDPLNKKRFVVPFKTKKEADDKAAQLKRDGCKNITITKHDLNFKDPIQKKEQVEQVEVDSAYEISGVENNGREVIEESKTKYERYTGVKNRYTEGRRSHYASDDEDEEGANKNIIMQLKKSLNLRNMYNVVFDDGKKVKVKEPVARAAIAKWETFRLSRDKLAFQNKIGKSYRDLLNTIKR